MFRRTATALASALITLWAIATGTFLLMEHAPGGPLSGERRLEPTVEAANLARLGLAELVRSPCDGLLRQLIAEDAEVEAGGPAGVVGGAGEGCLVQPDRGGTVLLALAVPGDTVRQDQPLLAVRLPLWTRYARSMGALARMDLGVTFTSRGERTVRENLADGLPVSMAIGGLALAFAVLLGIPFGLWAAARRGSVGDRLLGALSTAAVSVPAIVLGPFLLYMLAIRFRVFRPGGLEGIQDLVLPAMTLGLILAGVLQRMTRAGASSFLEGPIAFGLRARGIPERRVVGVHALRHAAIPMLGFLPPAVASLLTGSVVVETVFHLPGVARYLVGAALNRDHPMVMGVVLTYSVLLVVCTAIADLAHPVLDPRLRPGGPTAQGTVPGDVGRRSETHSQEGAP
jgi:oligopeptide transport system permease protein